MSLVVEENNMRVRHAQCALKSPKLELRTRQRDIFLGLSLGERIVNDLLYVQLRSQSSLYYQNT
jgi:hypothetical protein